MRAAVLVPLYEDDSGTVRVVLTKRPGNMRTHAGDVVFPGGRIEEQDTGPVDTAIRESCEEIGLPESAIIEVMGGLGPVTTRSAEMIVVPVVARIERPSRFVPDPSEVEVILEPSIHDLLGSTRWVRRDWQGHPLWFFEFPEGVLWGATAFMVQDLLSFLR